MAGRNRKPTALLKLNGSFEHNRGRYAERENEPKPAGGLGECGSNDPIVKQAWRDISSGAAAGVLTSSDSIAVEIAADLLSKFRAGSLDSAGRKDLMQLLAKFGMNPADRSKIVVGQKQTEETDELARIAAESKIRRIS